MSVNRHLILDPDSLLSALEACESSHPLHEGHPLFSFYLVQTRLERPEYLEGEFARLHAVETLLLECFEQVLGEQSDQFAALEALQKDFRGDNLYLQSYSFLYYRFMRPELGLTLESIARHIGLAPRTLQRRQNDG